MSSLLVKVRSGRRNKFSSFGAVRLYRLRNFMSSLAAKMKSGPDVFADALVRVAGILAGVFISQNFRSKTRQRSRTGSRLPWPGRAHTPASSPPPLMECCDDRLKPPSIPEPVTHTEKPRRTGFLAFAGNDSSEFGYDRAHLTTRDGYHRPKIRTVNQI
ncbi:hypothetical protein Q2941_32815 [Bradyrhizobium sp. UFLA05-153]